MCFIYILNDTEIMIRHEKIANANANIEWQWYDIVIQSRLKNIIIPNSLHIALADGNYKRQTLLVLEKDFLPFGLNSFFFLFFI